MTRASDHTARNEESDGRAYIAARVYEPPTDEQLVNFALVMALGPGATDSDKDTVRALLRYEPAREEWLRRHREMQEAAWNL